jgi:hypothetical protein
MQFSLDYRERITQKYGPVVLDALDLHSPLNERDALPAVVDLSYPMVYYVVKGLEGFGLVAKTGGMIHITERGKIALALVRGYVVKRPKWSFLPNRR